MLSLLLLYCNLKESHNADTFWRELKRWDAANYVMGASIGGNEIEKVAFIFIKDITTVWAQFSSNKIIIIIMTGARGWAG